MKIECPECHTAYESDRLGVFVLNVPMQVTVLCVLCKRGFDATITPAETSWLGKTVLRRPARTYTVDARTRD